MNRNVGILDRSFRILIVVAFFLCAVFWFGFHTLFGIVMLSVALFLLATTVVSFCPLYKLFGMNTIRRSSN